MRWISRTVSVLFTWVLVGAVVWIADPAPAKDSEAQKATLGSDIAKPPPPSPGFGVEISCKRTRSCSIVPTRLGSDNLVTAPFNGTITRWRVRRLRSASKRPYPVRLRVVRRVGDEYSLIGRGDRAVVSGGPGLKRFDADLAVHQGDHIAIDFLSRRARAEGLLNSDARALQIYPAPRSGEPVDRYRRSQGYEMPFNATLIESTP